jgi:DNA helicase-2/ATP-dependent DNA helicase PcrA
MEHGEQVLTQYYEDRHTHWHKEVMLEKWLQTTIGNAPIKGKIDKIELYENETCRVVDYKTGKWRSESKAHLSVPTEQEPNGGDYWRQMVFYKLLVERQPFSRLKVTEGSFEYVEGIADAKYDYLLPITEQDTFYVEKMIQEVYWNIRNFRFEEGCKDPDCAWCQFTHNHGLRVPFRARTEEEPS